MKKYIFLLFFLTFTTNVSASIKKDIIENLKKLKIYLFNFEQNINGKLENGNCIIEYPKKNYCKYNSNKNKILVSNGRSLVIKTSSSFYIYPIEKTALDLILDKNFLLKKVKNLNERIINDKLINFKFFENGNEINIFFDKKTFNLIGWQTLDPYQNLSITYLNSIIKNQKIEKDIFELPQRN